MGYIAVDIPHFILVLFILFVCSKQIPAIYEIVQVVMVLGRTYLTRIVWHVFVKGIYAGICLQHTRGTLKAPHGVVCLIGEFSQCRSKLHMTL